MSSYIKISYETKGNNIALKECIAFIGRYYGKKMNDPFKSGVMFLSKKVVHASTTSIYKMVYSKKIKNSDARQWSFKKRSYADVYRYIIYRMLHASEHRAEALSLLHGLFMDLKTHNREAKYIVSDILVPEQKDLLKFAIDKPQYESNLKHIDKILREYAYCDDAYKIYLGLFR